jgi:probable HAF family extracellular repeat protein
MNTTAVYSKLVSIAGCILALAAPSTSAQQTYRITDLGTLGGTKTVGAALNNSGKVTGHSWIKDDADHHAFFWNGTTMRDLGTLGGSRSTGVDINASGQVTGTSATGVAGGNRAFLWTDGTMLDLGTLGGPNSAATGINNAGQVTGVADDDTSHFFAFLYSGGQMINLGPNPPNADATSVGRGINNSGQVVIDGFTHGDNHAYLYSDGELTNLGALGGSESFARAINDAGQVIGFADRLGEASDGAAFLYSDGEMINLGTLGLENSQAHAINNAGQVTGFAYEPKRAFLYSGGMTMDLGTLGGGFSVGHAINKWGQVTGASAVPGGMVHAFLSDGGPMFDLNALVDPADPLKTKVTLGAGIAINSRGQILVQNTAGVDGMRVYFASPVEYQIAFLTPSAGSAWRRGTTVFVKVALIGMDGKRIPDARAAELAAAPCRVTFSATGAQSKTPVCMKYDSVANRFYFMWKLGATRTGAVTMKVAVKYGSPSRVTTTKTRNITITN